MHDLLGSLFLIGERAAALRLLLDTLSLEGLLDDERNYFNDALAAVETRNAELMISLWQACGADH